MKPKNPKPAKPLSPSPVELSQEAGQEMQQVLTFETVEEMLSYDRAETDVPDAVVRKLRRSLPGETVKPVKLAEPKPWKPRPEG